MADESVSKGPKRSVTIFGAGVAGLTAAHELVERGFRVEVIDPDIREEIHSFTLDRGIGGMARSQWGCRLPGMPPARTKEGAPPRLEPWTNFLVDDVLVFDPTTKEPEDPLFAEQMLNRAAALIERLVGLDGDMTRMSEITVVAPVSGQPEGDDYRVQHVLDRLSQRLGTRAEATRHMSVELVQLDGLEVTVHGRPRNTWLFFHLPNLEIFPGEHGFRFFPSFYRHVFDSLRRIPINHPRPHERTIATVRDNLVPSEGLGFARAGMSTSFLIPRREVRSLETARKYLTLVLQELGYELSDLGKVTLRLLEYMTSSTKRRAGEYEDLSWGRFVDQDDYSPTARQHIEFGPQMSAALRGSLSDARTQGNISVQLFMDQLRSDGRPDCTLNSPTNSAWLNHWHDYLASQGVRFRRGTLVGFEEVDGSVQPKVFRSVERDEGGNIVRTSKEVPTNGHYIVLALSLPAAREVAKKFVSIAGGKLPPDNDFARTIAFGGEDLERDLEQAAPKGPLQHLSGIQFYFDVPIDFWRGHTQYLDSEWGLTSIAQPQFWGRRRDQLDRCRGILSVDIGIWDREYRGKTAWQCTPDEIAAYAWEQICDHHDDAFRERYGRDRPIPSPIAYAIDANITFDRTPKKDRSPFLVNRVGAYSKRPGRLIDDGLRDDARSAPPRSKQVSYYDVHLGRYVLVGTFMKTYTRLTSMEGANESARHGVNAILRDANAACENCEIWDPEDNEIPDFQWLRDLDEKRFDEGKPHLIRTATGLDPFDVHGPDIFDIMQGGRRGFSR